MAQRASVCRLQVLRYMHSASRRLPDADWWLRHRICALCLRSPLIFQVLNSPPGVKCTKSLSFKPHTLNSTSPLVSSSGFQTHEVQVTVYIHRGMISFSALQFVPNLIPVTIHIVQSERKLSACPFFFPSFHMAD